MSDKLAEIELRAEKYRGVIPPVSLERSSLCELLELAADDIEKLLRVVEVLKSHVELDQNDGPVPCSYCNRTSASAKRALEEADEILGEGK